MQTSALESVLDYLRKQVGSEAMKDLSDTELLERFCGRREEAAFALLLQRHGPTVLGVCRRMLGDVHAAEDAFQATFLVLVRKAGCVRKRQSLGSFLYGVAYRTAARARMQTAERRSRDRAAVASSYCPDALDELSRAEACAVLHEELARLPDRYRRPLVLCYLEGKTHEQAAREMAWPKSSVSGRLKRGCELLRQRLSRRGIALSAGMLTVLLADQPARAVPALLTLATVRLAAQALAGKATLAAASVGMAGGVLKAVIATRTGTLLALLLLTVGLAAAGVGVLASQPEKPKTAPPPVARPAEQPKTEPVAEVKTGDPPVDRQGDPLPEGALARLGTGRLGHRAVICSIAFSGDNKLLATAGFDSFVNVWDASTGQRLLHVSAANFREESNVANVALSPDGSCLATAWINSPPELWDVRTGKKLRAIGDTLYRGSKVQFTEDGKYLAITQSADGLKDGFSANEAKTAVLAKVDTGKVIFSSEGKILLLPDGFIHLDPHRPELSLRKLGDNDVSIQFTGHEGSVNAAALTPDGKKLFTHGSDRTIRVWDTATGKELRRLDKTPETPCQLVPAPDASNVLTLVKYASSMQCWDVKSGQVRWTATMDKDGFVQAKFLPGGNTVVTGHSSGRLRQWDVRTGKEQKVIRTIFDGTISLMVLSPDGKTLATSSNQNGMNQKVYLWDAATLTPKAVHQGHSQQIVAAAFCPDGRIVATSARDRTVRLWEPRTGNLIRTIETPTNASRSLVFTPDGKTLITANGYGVEGEVRFWEVATGKEMRKFKAHPSGVVLLALAPDGKRLFTSGSDDRFRCWDLDAFKQLGEFGDEKPSSMLRIALSPDGSTFATAHMDSALRIWDARTFKKRYQLTGEPGQQIGAITFSPDNSLLAWSDGSAGIRLTDAASGKEVRGLPSETGSFDGIVFAPDGKTLAWGINYRLPATENAVGIWEVRSGQLRRTLDGSDGSTLPLAHSPNGALLVTADSDCSALVWDMNRRPSGKQAVGIPSPEKLDQCWRLLADHDAAKAFDGMETFTQFPEQGVARIAEDLKPIPPRAPAEKVAALLRDLDGDLFEIREAATRELERLDETVIADLQRLAKKSESVEARTRAERLLERMDPIRLQRERAIEILEMIGNTSAVKLLKSLADGQPDAPLTRDARGALQRLKAKE